MKLANVSWGWTPIPEDMPHGDSLIRIADQIRELGFEGVDYLGTPEALDEFFTEEACRALGDHSRSIGLEPNVFVFQDASWNDACSEKREDSVRHFEKAAQAAKWIGCRIVSTLVPMPCGATPWKFNPAAPAIKQGYHMPAPTTTRCLREDPTWLRRSSITWRPENRYTTPWISITIFGLPLCWMREFAPAGR